MLKIYGVPISVHTRKVIVAVIEKGLQYENVQVAPVIPESVPPDWPQLSPTGKIPVLQDGDRTLADSSVICAYLDRRYPWRPVYPSQDEPYVRALWLEEYADGTVFPEIVRPLFHQTFVGPRIHGREPDRAAVATVREQAIPRVFGYLESVVDPGFVAGPRLIVADVAIVSNLVTYQYLGFPLDGRQFPRLSAYFERVVRQPSIQEALRAEQPVARSMGLWGEFLEAVLA